MDNDNLLENEVANLRQRLVEKTEKVKGFENRFDRESQAHDVVREYKDTPIEKVVPPHAQITAGEKHRIIEWLKPKETDRQVEMLFQVMAEKGVRNAIHMSEELNNPEVEDDFERALVQYILSGHEVKNNISKEEWKSLHMVLFEVILPEGGEEGHEKTLPQMMGLMEQWYTSMQSLASDPTNKDKNYYTLELSTANGSTSVSFYCAVHTDYKEIFEKVVLGVFPRAQVKECKEDYNIFHHNAVIDCSYATLATVGALPVKTYKKMEADPMSLILSSFSKIKKENEGLALQLLIRPSSDIFVKKYTSMLDGLRKGETLKRVIDKQSFLKETFHVLDEMFSSKTKEEREKEEKDKLGSVDEVATKHIQEKLEHTIVETNIRIVASAESFSRVTSIRKDLEASFHQFNEVGGNSIVFKMAEGRKQKAMLHRFLYRLWNDDESIPFNLEELATVFHFPEQNTDLANIKEGKYKKSEAPSDMPTEGITLGYNESKLGRQMIHYGREDRVRHMYVIGQTGTGKSVFLRNMIAQDMKNGDGVCYIDPHGTDILDILSDVPPERAEDVIYFDPAYMPRPMGLNMLEYDREFPEQKTFVINEMLGIFNKLFDMKATGGPGFEQYFRNAAKLVMEHPESGNTLIDVGRIFADKDFRDYKLSKCKDPLLMQFWQGAEKSKGEQGLENWTQYVTSKFDNFTTNDIMRPIIAQEKSTFNIREIMDKKKIFLVNLSKGRLGDINSSLLGLILVGKFSQAALSRVNSTERPDFYLYIDEFQNISTPAISSILSEARKYRLSLNLAHQYIGQLEEDIKNAVFGNVGSVVTFRISSDDAKYMESQFDPIFKATDIMKIDNRNAYLKLLVRGEPKKPFDITVLPPEKGDINKIDALKELSYLKYGRPREEVEAEIMKKYSLG